MHYAKWLAIQGSLCFTSSALSYSGMDKWYTALQLYSHFSVIGTGVTCNMLTAFHAIEALVTVTFAVAITAWKNKRSCGMLGILLGVLLVSAEVPSRYRGEGSDALYFNDVLAKCDTKSANQIMHPALH